MGAGAAAGPVTEVSPPPILKLRSKPITLVGEVLRRTEAALASASILECRLEAEVMLMHVLQVPRHHLYAYQDQEVEPAQKGVLDRLLRRRIKREPLAYILGYREFYGLTLVVRPGVMVPRSETELLVEHALFMALMNRDEEEAVIAEAGVGCGAICTNLAIHLPSARIYATDLHPTALEVASLNIDAHKVADQVTLLQGDLLEPVPEDVDLIVANLPYVRSDAIPHLQPEVQWEPREALDGGPDGMDIIRRLLRQAKDKLKKGGVILLEIDPEQVAPLRQEAEMLFPGAAMSTEQDLAHRERLFVLQQRST